jgi:hypothetical protein
MIPSRRAIIRAIVMTGVVFAARTVSAQHQITVTVPSAVSFNVVNVAATTAGTPESTKVTYANASGFGTNEKLRVSVQADASTFAGPGSTHIAASKLSWIASATAGTPSSGTLAAGSYTLVYQSPNHLSSSSTGSVSFKWSLAAIAAAGLRSGTHTLTVRWKFEAF